MKRPHWRKMTVVIWLWCIAIIAWAVAGGSSSASKTAAECAHEAGLRKTCEELSNAGTGIGVAIVLLIGFVGFVFLSLIWIMSRPKGRMCPVCGENVKRGRTVCKDCGHDFAATVATTA